MIPRLRIDGYSEDWIEVKIGDLYSNLRTGNTPSRRVKDFFGGHIPWVTSGELNRGKISDTAEKITQEAATSANLKLYPIGTFFMAITGLEAPGTRGKCGIIQIPATTNQSCLAFEESDKVSNRFLFHWYLHNSERLYQKFAQGTKQESYNNKIVASFRIFIPSQKEQNEITHLLDIVDQKINLLTKKKEALETYKKGLMQKIFSQELRFKREDGTEYPNWTTVNLSDVCKIFGRIGFRGYTVKDIVDKGEGAITISPSDITNNKINFDDCTYISMAKYEESPEIKIFNGDILLVKTASIGKSAIVKNLEERATINPQFVVLKEILLDNDFLYYQLNYSDFKRQIQKIAAGGVLKTISQEHLKALSVLKPSKEEQIKIFKALSSADKYIEKIELQIELSKKQKQGLLQQMFV